MVSLLGTGFLEHFLQLQEVETKSPILGRYASDCLLETGAHSPALCLTCPKDPSS